MHSKAFFKFSCAPGSLNLHLKAVSVVGRTFNRPDLLKGQGQAHRAFEVEKR